MKIVFFSIPAYGHTNPTISVINELTKLGHEVWFYSFNEFKDKIEAANATFISCDKYLPVTPKNLDKIVGKDFAALIEMVTATTVSLDEKVCSELRLLKPDCIVSDSICFWGKLFAYKLNIPYVCSTTTFAFNQYTAKLMQRTFGQLLKILTGMPRINKCIKVLNEHEYHIKNFISIIQNEQQLVARRVEELGAGRFLAANKVESIYETVMEVLNDKSYKINAQEISKGFHNSGGSKKGALAILKVIADCEKQR